MGAERNILAVNDRLGTLAHDLRNLVHTASLAFTAIKMGGMGMGGATGPYWSAPYWHWEKSLSVARLLVPLPPAQLPIQCHFFQIPWQV